MMEKLTERVALRLDAAHSRPTVMVALGATTHDFDACMTVVGGRPSPTMTEKLTERVALPRIAALRFDAARLSAEFA